jgi:hypothetical protein
MLVVVDGEWTVGARVTTRELHIKPTAQPTKHGVGEGEM